MKKTKKSGWKRALLILACVLLALVLLVLLAAAFGMAYLDHMWGMTQRLEDKTDPTLSSSQIAELETQTEPEDADDTSPVVAPEDVVWETTPAETIGGEEADNIINILLIGQDRREGEGRARSDAMILCTVNTDTKTLTMTSFLRDLYVQIPGYQDNRINASYQFGGMPLLNQCLEVNFGIQVDGNVEVDFGEFKKIIDLMGGVSISLTEREASYLNTYNAGDWNLCAGTNNLTGEQALAYSRIRKLDNDFGRTNRQRKVLTALLNKCKKMSLSQLNDLLEQILPLVTTDIETTQLVAYAAQLLPILDELTVTTQHIPASGMYYNARIRGMSVLVPDLEQNRRLLLDTLVGQE